MIWNIGQPKMWFSPNLEESIATAKTAAEGGGGTPQNQPAEEVSEEVTEPASGTEPEGGEPAEALKTDTTPTESGVQEPAEGIKPKGSASVPYPRFKEINDTLKEERTKNQELAGKVDALITQLQSLTQPRDTGPKLDQNQRQVKEYYLDPVLKPIAEDLKSIKEELTASKEAAKLDKALTDLSAKYSVVKDVPYARNVLENYYLENGGKGLAEIAEALQKYFENRDKKLITDYVGGKKKAAATNKGATPPGSAPAYQPKPLPKTATLEERFAAKEPLIKQAIKDMKEQ